MSASTRSTSGPIRVALVGLSANAVTSWAATAHLPGLLHDTSRFRITALLNSSEDAARAAIAKYSLDPHTTRAYGKVEDLAQDKEVDLVIVSTRVDKHYESAIAAVRAGKDVFVEWPIASRLAEMEELEKEAKEKGVRVAVGLQGRWAPPVEKLRELVRGGRYGKLLSADVKAYGGTMDREKVAVGLAYFAERKVGGNVVTIGFGHVIDFVQSVVGELDEETTRVRTQIQRPVVPLCDPTTREVVDQAVSDVPDLVSLHGTIRPSAYTATYATLSTLFRRGQPFPGTPALTISLVCERAEIVLTSPDGISLQADGCTDAVAIRLHDFATDKVESVPWKWSDEQMQVPRRARSVQQTLCALADRKPAGDGWVDVGDALKRARQIEGWLNQTPSPST